MLKLLTCAAVTIPCLILPFAGAKTSTLATSEKASFDNVFLQPKLENLQKCQAAEMDIFFRDSYVTTHSAESIAAVVTAAGMCGKASFDITPIAHASEDKAKTLASTTELSLMLNAHNVDASISAPAIESKFNNLTGNGRKAILTISFGVIETDNT